MAILTGISHHYNKVQVQSEDVTHKKNFDYNLKWKKSASTNWTYLSSITWKKEKKD